MNTKLAGAMAAAGTMIVGVAIFTSLGSGNAPAVPTVPGASLYDLNGDAAVSLADVSIMLDHVGQRAQPHFCLWQVENVPTEVPITPESVAPYDFGGPAPGNPDEAFVFVPNTYPDYATLYAGGFVPFTLCRDPYLNTPTPNITPAPTIGP